MRLGDDLGDAKLGKEGGEEEDAGAGGLEAAAMEVAEEKELGGRRDLCTFDRDAELDADAAREAREALLSEDAFDSAD